MHRIAEAVESRSIVGLPFTVASQPAGEVCAVGGVALSCPARMGGPFGGADPVLEPLSMVHSGGISGAGLEPSRRVAGVAGDDIAGEAARAAGRAAWLWLLQMMVMMPHGRACGSAGGDGAGHDVSVEGARLRMPVPDVSDVVRRRSVAPAAVRRTRFAAVPVPSRIAAIGSRYGVPLVTVIFLASAACDARADEPAGGRRVEIGVLKVGTCEIGVRQVRALERRALQIGGISFGGA